MVVWEGFRTLFYHFCDTPTIMLRITTTTPHTTALNLYHQDLFSGPPHYCHTVYATFANIQVRYIAIQLLLGQSSSVLIS
jgi:hypothetical protein